jgi:hypothetical protein
MMSRFAHLRGLVPACIVWAAALAAMVAPGTAGASLGEQCSGTRDRHEAISQPVALDK